MKPDGSVQRIRAWASLLRWLVTGSVAAFFLFAGGVLPALGHGDEAISIEEAGNGFLEVDQYQLLLEKGAAPITVGKKSPHTIRVYDTRLKKLVTGGKVLLSIKLPQIVPKNRAKNQVGSNGHGSGQQAADPSKSLESYLTSPPQWTKEGRPVLSDFQEAIEVIPGHYQIRFTPTVEGLHFLKVALWDPENPGRPRLTQFNFQVVPPKGWNGRFLAASGLFVLMVLSGAAALGLRRRFPDRPWSAINLLDLSPLRRLFQWRYFQPMFQIPFLGFLVLIVILGFFDTQDAGKNLATRLTWTIWWAGVIFTFVLVGRVWCMMCPYGAATEWASRLVEPKRKFPKRLRNLWMANILFLGLTWMDGYFGLVGSPRATAWFLLLILLVAVGLGALFPRRSFCRYVCPIGGLIGVYSMFSPIELRAENQEVCKADKTFACYMGTEQAYGCPMFEDPRRMDSNLYCNYCAECVKACPQSNLILRLRPFAKDLWTKVRKRSDESVLAIGLVAVTLMAMGHMIEPWHQWMDSLTSLIPFRALGITDHVTIEKVIYTLVLLEGTGIILVLTWLTAVASRRLAGNGSSLSSWETLKIFGYMFIPIGLAAHLSHNLLHLLSEAQMVVPVFQKTVNAYTPFFLGTPNWSIPPLMAPDAVYWLQMGTFLLFFGYALFIGYSISRQVYSDGSVALRALSPMVLLALGFAILNVFLLSQGMNPRHAH
jgi:polyferredoxin